MSLSRTAEQLLNLLTTRYGADCSVAYSELSNDGLSLRVGEFQRGIYMRDLRAAQSPSAVLSVVFGWFDEQLKAAEPEPPEVHGPQRTPFRPARKRVRFVVHASPRNYRRPWCGWSGT